ncbi:MAG: COR domain-containing protein, partial [Bacteroidota bacterium]
QGKFYLTDLIRIWQNETPDLRPEDAEIFLNFMIQSGTAFYANAYHRREDKNPQIVIPQLLPKERPLSLQYWDSDHIHPSIQHQIIYPFLHRGIIEQFIAQLAHLSEDKVYWREGILLNRRQNQVLVEVKRTAEVPDHILLTALGRDTESFIKEIRKVLNAIRPLDKTKEYWKTKENWQPFIEPVQDKSLDKTEDLKRGEQLTKAPQYEVSITQNLLDQAKDQAVSPSTKPKKRKAFISYASADREHIDPFLRHLKSLRNKLIVWEYHQIQPGEDWDERIKQEMLQAEIVFYLVSANSMDSDYIEQVELPALEARAEEGACILVPIILNFYNWQKESFAKRNVLPRKGTPVLDQSKWVNVDQAWVSVIAGIESLLKDT